MKTLTREQIIEVLKPFIEFANERLDESDNTPDSHIVYQYDKKVITIGDLRRLEILASDLSGQKESEVRTAEEILMGILESFDMYLRKAYGEIRFNYDDAAGFVKKLYISDEFASQPEPLAKQYDITVEDIHAAIKCYIKDKAKNTIFEYSKGANDFADKVLKAQTGDEFHVWVIPVKNEIFVEDRGGGYPVGATEHITFDTWEGAFKLGQFLAKFCNYTLELDNEAGRFAEDSFFKSRLQDHITGQKDDSIAKTETDTGKIVDMPELVSKQDHAKAMRDDKILKSK